MNPSLVDFLVVSVSAAASYIFVGIAREYAVTHRVIDLPNARSSHVNPTPRGGGVAIVLTFCCVGAWLLLSRGVPATWLVLLGAAAVGGVGWADDHRNVSIRSRLLVHFASGVGLAWLYISFGGGAAVAALWLCWTVSAINVINFMDGIDTLVTSQLIIFCAVVAVLTPAHGVARPLAETLLGACGAFLVWNWPPARIFLGDVGSGALGFAVAALGLLAISETGHSVVRIYLPLFPLFLDATWTFMRRLRNGENPTMAHRSHLYQRLANGRFGKGRVSSMYALAAAIGALLAVTPDWPGWGLSVGAYVVVVVIAASLLDRLSPFVWYRDSRDATFGQPR
ncbi:MAG: glycosyltransferase family 4 protein [Gemmatimonadota bacterium]|nr:glycosyltransferase family 4 protein [Gemmatimonadota bacterium]